MERDPTADTAAPPITSDAADASFKIGDLHIDERERISYTRDRILQIREVRSAVVPISSAVSIRQARLLLHSCLDIEISEGILKVKQLIEVEFDDTKSEDLHYQGRERICYSIDRLLQLQEASATPSFSGLSGPPPETDNLVQRRAQMEDCTRSSGQSECTYFMKFGTCKFGSTCKYKHTRSSATSGPSLADGPIQRPTHMNYTERHHQSDCPNLLEFGTCKFGPACKYQDGRPLASNYCTSQMDGPILRQPQMEEYPLSPVEPLCSYFIKLGTCKFESAYKFHHPSPSTLSYLTPEADGPIHHEGQLDEYPQTPGEPECSYFIKHGTCKFKSACKFHHPSPSTSRYLTTEADVPIHHEGQFYEYPQRPGELECSHFIKHGTCKFRYTCKFHHPAPSTLTGLTVKVHDPVHWEQMEEYPQRPGEPECSYFIKYGTCKFRYSCKFHHPTPSTVGCLTVKVDDSVYWEQMEEYPQRPGEPECSYFIKYGTCKFESACKFHHPFPTTLGGQTTEANVWVRHQGHLGHSEIPGEADCQPTVPLCIISPAGLPLRPGQQTCSYYSRSGTCKFGPQCRFDHPMDMHNGSSVPAVDLKHGQG